MRLKLVGVLLLAVACFVAVQLWTLWLQPDVITDLALEQMKRSDDASAAMRTASQAQQWPALAMMAVFVVGTLWIFGRSFCHKEAHP